MAGRPADLDRIVATIPIRDKDDNIVSTRDVTVQERIVELIRAGNYVETAAAAVGMNKTTLYAWLRDGARAQRKVIQTAENRPKDRYKPTRYEQRAIGFSNALNDAMALGEADDVTRLARAAQGGQVVETITETVNPDGTVVRTVVRKTLPPDVGAIKWRLERRFSRRWGQRGSLEVTGADGAPLMLDPDAIVAKLRAAREAHQDDVEIADEEPQDPPLVDVEDG